MPMWNKQKVQYKHLFVKAPFTDHTAESQDLSIKAVVRVDAEQTHLMIDTMYEDKHQQTYIHTLAWHRPTHCIKGGSTYTMMHCTP